MADPQIHMEEYLYLAHLSHNTAIIAWGAFFFTKEGEPTDVEWDLIDDDDLDDDDFDINRHSSIGATSEPYARPGTLAEVELTEKGTANVLRINPPREFNHAVFTDLKPDTIYTYRVTVNGKQWAGGQLHDWDERTGTMVPSARVYNNEFRTFPSPEAPSPPLTFAILGDFGRGVKKPSSGETCQREIAQTLMRVAEDNQLRLILSNGDNIYRASDGSGKEDDDWFFTFFQPYRYLLNRVPLFPAVGNHDEGETLFESSDDRTQVYDNTFIRERFGSLVPVDEAALDHGLFYRFRFGRDIEFICLDTSKKRLIDPGGRFFRNKKNKPFIEKAFPEGGGVKWLLPYFHHPPYCAGPGHLSKESVREFFTPFFVRSGVRAVFSGHQHSFQHSLDTHGINYFVTGASGKYDNGLPHPGNFAEARTQAWGSNDEGHLLLVSIDGNKLEATPFGKLNGNQLRPIKINKVAATAPDEPPFVVEV